MLYKVNKHFCWKISCTCHPITSTATCSLLPSVPVPSKDPSMWQLYEHEYRDSKTLSATTKECDSQSLCDMQTSTSCNHTIKQMTLWVPTWWVVQLPLRLSTHNKEKVTTFCLSYQQDTILNSVKMKVFKT